MAWNSLNGWNSSNRWGLSPKWFEMVAIRDNTPWIDVLVMRLVE